MPDELLTAATVLPYLRARGVIGPEPATADELGGGVSNVVLAVRAGETGLVLKQALPRLRVAEEWLAKRERTLVEARALGLAPRSPPAPHRGCSTSTRSAARSRSSSRRRARSRGRTCCSSARSTRASPATLGRLLGAWHGDAAAAAAFDEWDSFEQLRIDPYYREVARRHPALAADVLGYADAMARAAHRVRARRLLAEERAGRRRRGLGDRLRGGAPSAIRRSTSRS